MFFFFLLCICHGMLDEEGLFIVVPQEPRQSQSQTLLTAVPERRESITGSVISHQILTGHKPLLRTSYRTRTLSNSRGRAGSTVLPCIQNMENWKYLVNVPNDHHGGETDVQVSRKQSSWQSFNDT